MIFRLIPVLIPALFTLTIRLAYAMPTAEEFVEMCQNGRAEDVRKALADGAAVNSPNKNGWPPLNAAAMNISPDGPEVVKLLIEAGADVNEPEILSWLVGAGADVNAATNSGLTALMVAASSIFPSQEHLEILLKAGANPNMRDKDGHTALDLARESPAKKENKDEIIKFLVAYP